MYIITRGFTNRYYYAYGEWVEDRSRAERMSKDVAIIIATQLQQVYLGDFISYEPA